MVTTPSAAVQERSSIAPLNTEPEALTVLVSRMADEELAATQTAPFPPVLTDIEEMERY